MRWQVIVEPPYASSARGAYALVAKFDRSRVARARAFIRAAPSRQSGSHFARAGLCFPALRWARRRPGVPPRCVRRGSSPFARYPHGGSFAPPHPVKAVRISPARGPVFRRCDGRATARACRRVGRGAAQARSRVARARALIRAAPSRQSGSHFARAGLWFPALRWARRRPGAPPRWAQIIWETHRMRCLRIRGANRRCASCAASVRRSGRCDRPRAARSYRRYSGR